MAIKRITKSGAEQVKREGLLASHIIKNTGPFDASSLAKSWAVPVERVVQIIKRNGGNHG